MIFPPVFKTEACRIECREDQHIVFWAQGASCKCVCNNLGSVKCVYPYYYDEKTCEW